MNSSSWQMVIERPQLADLPALVQIEQECGLSSWGTVGYDREMLNPQAILLAAYDEKTRELVGYFSGHIIVDEFELLSIAVRADLRHNGIGSALLMAGCQELRVRHVTRCWLEVRSLNLPAINFYEKFNFRAVGRRRNYYQSPPDDAIIMQWAG